MKIVHVFNDDKFPKMAYRIFEEVYPGKNEFIIFSKKELVHNKEINAKQYHRAYLYCKPLINNIIDGDIVVFHGMNQENLIILKLLPKKIKTIWIGWGFDYYDLIGRPLLKEETKKYSASNHKNNTNTKNLIKDTVKGLLWKYINKKRLIQKVDLFAPVLKEDYDLILEKIPDFRPKYMPWNYGTLEDDHVRAFEGKLINGDNILLGNSALATNNHLDAFDLVSSILVGDRKLIVPLSYGDRRYRNFIIEQSNEVFAGKFCPLVEFMPIEQYIETLQSCSIVVMNHLRQQALGNIVMALYMGAKVFLDYRNPIYSFFKEQGAYIYRIEELKYESTHKLSVEQVETNRKLLRNHWSREVVLQKTQNLVEEALYL